MDPLLVPSRRQILAMAGGAALVAAVPAVAQAVVTGPVTLDEFMELSEALTDNEFSLRDEVGAQYLAALDPADITKLVQATVRAGDPKTFNAILGSGALNDPTNAATARQVLVYWYSGLVSDRTADYLEALAWESLRDGDLAVVSSTPLGFPDWDERP